MTKKKKSGIKQSGKYEYKATSPSFVGDYHKSSPLMDYREMEDWLNNMDFQGWEFVSYGQKIWNSGELTQDWWIFRRLRKGDS